MKARIITSATAALLIGGIASAAFGCDLPPLVAIPPKDQIGDRAQQIQGEFKAYYDAMAVYSQCVQADLDKAGGDKAPTIVKAVLVQRNNAAVSEASAMLKLYNESLGTAAPGGAEGTPPAADNERGRRRDR
jgi:hypothetical protein